jgi:predicted DNA-binding protein with PD1-like motif
MNERDGVATFNAIKVMKMNMAKGKINDILVIRLQRGDEIMESIKYVCQKYDIKNAVIMSMIGSLCGAKYYDPVMNPKVKCGISYADPIFLQCPVQFLSGHGEIFPNEDGNLGIHIHAVFADSKGNAYGGHLAEEGNQALNTINIFIGVIEGVEMGFKWDDILGTMAPYPKEV